VKFIEKVIFKKKKELLKNEVNEIKIAFF